MKKVKFAVLADFHSAFVPNAMDRLNEFLNACEEEKVNFIVQLGDFSFPYSHAYNTVESNKIYIDTLNNFHIPVYPVLGNHDTEYLSKKEAMALYGFKSDTSYYSFDVEPFHFVVLDGNYINDNGNYIEYSSSNWVGARRPEGSTLNNVSPEELEWLENDLKNAKYPSILFSHQRLTSGHDGINNHEAIKKVFDTAPNKVVMSINGHEHLEHAELRDNIWYYSMLCATNFLLYDDYRFTPEQLKYYPENLVRDFPLFAICPYSKCQFGIFTADENGVHLKGTNGGYMGLSPELLNHPDTDIYPPYIPERYFNFNK